MKDIFSVIIPVYNAEAYIGEAIESALLQKEVSFEVIVVDDGSTDNSSSAYKMFGNHIKCFSIANSGSSVARNYGAKLATGNILAFLDADDIWMPKKLMTQKHKFEQGFNMVYTNRFNIGDKGDLPDIQSDIEYMPEGDIFESILMGNVITNSSVVIKKDIFLSLNGFSLNLSYCEDWDLWLRYASQNRIGHCPEPLVKYRLHSEAKSTKYKHLSIARERIISSILDTERGRNISSVNKRKAWAQAYCATGWCAAHSKDITYALKCYGKALRHCPFESMIWYNLARIIARRA